MALMAHVAHVIMIMCTSMLLALIADHSISTVLGLLGPN